MTYIADMELQFRFLLVDTPAEMLIGGYSLDEVMRGVLTVCFYCALVLFLCLLYPVYRKRFQDTCVVCGIFQARPGNF